ncbi:hypothetical protein [Ruminococcus sp. JL13D9]|uniref:hypothetical protein n=1 Tax=Ruminococcus sp. JL13D9 TaxID=3233381 RepID=UPI00389984B1
MKLMPALPESIFDICYLVFAIVSGVLLLKNSKGRKYVRIFGIMTLLLGCGDALHLVPRVLNYWTDGDYTAALGIGKLVTSITMTLFYILIEYARRDRYKIAGEKGVLASVWILGIIRIVLCCFPQNGWTSAEPSLLWGILRNIPFALLGILTVVLWLRSAKNDKPLKLMWLAVTLSFLFYIPVVLFAQTMPMIGMLMLPKTCMYVWMIVMIKKAGK